MLIILNKIKTYLKAFGLHLMEARQKSANRHIAMMHLSNMSDRELRDIGIVRGDIRRVVTLEK